MPHGIPRYPHAIAHYMGFDRPHELWGIYQNGKLVCFGYHEQCQRNLADYKGGVIEKILLTEKQIRMENLNKDNLFNELQEKYPAAMKHFCDWIDRYKEEVNWRQLFNHGITIAAAITTCAPKFHDLPFEMQFGIIMRYADEATDKEAEDRVTLDEMKEMFTLCMCYLQEEAEKKQS